MERQQEFSVQTMPLWQFVFQLLNVSTWKSWDLDYILDRCGLLMKTLGAWQPFDELDELVVDELP